MNTITQFIDLQTKAFSEGDIAEAQRLLDELEAHLVKQKSWHWLRSNEPEPRMLGDRLISSVFSYPENL